jgi:hypothetical protein
MPSYPKVLRTKEHAPTFFFWGYFILGFAFGFLKEFGGTSLGIKILVKA